MDDVTASQPMCGLPPGFRFHPTDEELVVHYLKKKAAAIPLPVPIIADIDLYKFDPWELPGKASYGEQEWYFFSPRERKYPNGMRPNRAAASGYWKATGIDKPIFASTTTYTKKVGVKKALVFYCGRPPKGIKTNWIMHEYRLISSSSERPSITFSNCKSLRLDDWVLCRIYKKGEHTSAGKQEKEEACSRSFTVQQEPESVQEVEQITKQQYTATLQPKLVAPSFDVDSSFFDNFLSHDPPLPFEAFPHLGDSCTFTTSQLSKAPPFSNQLSQNPPFSNTTKSTSPTFPSPPCAYPPKPHTLDSMPFFSSTPPLDFPPLEITDLFAKRNTSLLCLPSLSSPLQQQLKLQANDPFKWPYLARTK